MRSWPQLDATPFPRIYRLLLGLMPTDFLHSHGDSMAAMLLDRHRAEHPHKWRCLWREGGDLIKAGLMVRFQLHRHAPGNSAPASPTAFDTIRYDLKHAWRSLMNAPGFTAVALFILAVGIGANAAVFSLLDTAFLRPLPYPDAARLAVLYVTFENPGEPLTESSWSYPKLQAFRRAQLSFRSIGAVGRRTYNLTGIPLPARMQVEIASGDYFATLGVAAEVGRTFLPAEDSVPGSHLVVVLSHAEWQGRYGADPDVVGSVIELDGHVMSVVGVMPAGFEGLTGDTDLWMPLMMAPMMDYAEILEEDGNHWLLVVGRLDAQASLAQAGEDTRRAGLVIAEKFPTWAGSGGAVMRPLADIRVDPTMRASLITLIAAVAMVLLIGCVNIAALSFARGEARQRDWSIQLAIGATRGRITRQLLSESVLLAAAGGIGSVVVAFVALRGLIALAPSAGSSGFLFDLSTAAISWRVLMFTLLVTLLSAALFGVAPALRAGGRGSLALAVKGAFDTPPTSRAARLLQPQRVLVVVQVAVALVLLIGAGLLIKSFSKLYLIDHGFRPEGVVTFRLSPVFESRESRTIFRRALLDRLAALPGVEGVSVGSCAPLGGGCSSTVLRSIDGAEMPIESAPTTGIQYVGHGHFSLLGISLLRGREFTDADRVGSPKVAVINETAARRFWPGQDPVGKRISLHTRFLEAGAEVVGVVRDVRYRRAEREPLPEVFVPALQGGYSWTMVFVRSDSPLTTLFPALRAEIKALDPNLPLYDIRTMRDRMAAAVARQRLAAVLLGVFAGLAVILSAVGLYGVLSARVNSHRKDIGVRMALGATQGALLRGVLHEGVGLTLVGIAMGLGPAFLLTGLLTGLLYQVPPHDVAIFGTIAAMLALVATLTSLWPAVRASRVDPMTVLRGE